MNLQELIRKNRSYRRFYEDKKIERKELEAWIDSARLSASARNAQSLKYFISNKEDLNANIFEHLAWAGYLKDWNGPVVGERPSAYIIILNDTSISKNYFCDDGIAAQSILLSAADAGYGGCMIASVNKKKVSEIIGLPERYEILLVLALGKPKEKVVIDEIEEDGDIKYWRDNDDVHHVPKRRLKDIIIN